MSRSAPSIMPDPHRHLGRMAMVAVIAFAAVCLAAQFVRGDLDWQRAPLSLYLLGDYGVVVKAAYLALGAGLALLGAGYYRALTPAARSAAPLLLFVTAGLALDVTALADSDVGTGERTLTGLVHGIAANTAFLCVTVAMLLQSVRLRGDGDWRARFGVAFGLAAMSFAALWLHVLWRDAPRGLTQKSVIVLILLWLALAAAWLSRRTEPAGILSHSGESP